MFHPTREDFERFAGQNRAILERLARGPALNVELAELSLKYTSRVSDLRDGGFSIECERLEGGLTRYTLAGYFAPDDATAASSVPPLAPREAGAERGAILSNPSSGGCSPVSPKRGPGGDGGRAALRPKQAELFAPSATRSHW